ncbi:hypothetical protein OROMI_022884 [Orobanche minor]
MQSPKDAMPWVGLYVAVASLICTLAMAADLVQGFRQWKLWFPCRFFTINAASLTLIAIAMKLPVDLTTDMPDRDWNVRLYGLLFLFTMLANFLPSLGGMDDKELFTNIVALGILIITIIVNTCIQIATKVLSSPEEIPFLIYLLLWPFWVALTVPTSRRVLEQQYKELHGSGLNRHEIIKLSYEQLIHHVKKYWMMAETGNPQFVLACSPFCSASGLICSIFAFSSIYQLSSGNLSDFWDEKSDYKWSINVILTMQSIGIVVGSIAPIFRCITTISYFNISKAWSMNHLNMFRVEKHWTQRLRQWKHSHIVTSRIPAGRHCKKVFDNVKNMILNLCISVQITVVVICKTICLVPTSFMILLYYCCHFCNSLLKRFKEEPNVSNNNNNVRSEIEEYTSYVLQIEEEATLSNRMLRNMLRIMTKLLHESEEKQPRNLLQFLEKSTGFNGVVEYDDDRVPSLHPDEPHYCWSLVAVTLTAIALALPNIAKGHVKGLLASMTEGLQFVTNIEDTLNANGDLVKPRKTARRVWTEVEVYCNWLHIVLQKKAREGKMSREVLRWLGDEAVQIVIQFKRRKTRSVDDSLHKFIAASSMYRISQAILLHCNEQENWPTDEELFESITSMIADILCACFTNLPRVITLMCHHKAIEKRGESIRTAAQILGKSKKILNILEERQLPELDMYSMAYIDKWHALSKRWILNGCASSTAASPSSNESVTITIM